MLLAQPKGGLVLVGSCQKRLSFSKDGCGCVRYTWDSPEHPLGALVCHQGPHTPHMLLWGVATGVCLAGGLVFLPPGKFCASLSLALDLFPRRFRGCPFCCCWRVTRNSSKWFSEVTVSVLQVVLEGPSVPSGGVTAPCPSPALVTLCG